MPLRSLLLRLTPYLASCWILFAVHLHAEELPRFDHWQLFEQANELAENRDTWDLNTFLAPYRELSDLTPEEAASLQIFPALAEFLDFAEIPSTGEAQKSAIETLESLAPRSGPPRLPLEIAAEEALALAYSEATWPIRNDEQTAAHALRALETWEASDQLELARVRYLRLIRALPLWLGRYNAWEGASSESVFDSEIRQKLRRSLEIAETSEDLCDLHYRLAQTLAERTRIDQPTIREEAQQHYEAAFAHLEPSFPFAHQLLIEGARFFDQTDATRARAVEWTDFYLATFSATNDWRRSQVTSLRDALLKASLQITGPKEVFPGSTIQLSLKARNLSEATLTVQPLSVSTVIESFPNFASPSADAPILFEKTFETDPKDPPHADHLWSLRIPSNLSPGIYAVLVRSAQTSARHQIVISENTLSLQSDQHKILAQARSGKDGTPVVGKEIEVTYIFTANDNHSTLHIVRETKTSDTAGLAWFDLEDHSYPHYQYQCCLVSLHGEQPAICQFNNRFWYQPFSTLSDAEKHTLASYTDRPLYRPGETVAWKALVRRYTPGELSTPSNLTFEVTAMQNDSDRILGPWEAEIDANGSLSGEFVIPLDAPLGSWTLEFDAPDTISLEAHEAEFSIEEFRLPDFQAEIQLPEGAISRGSEVQGFVKVSAYSGEALVGAEVTLRITETTPYDHLSNASDRQPTKPRIIDMPPRMTDADGRVPFSFEARYGEEAQLDYAINATISDPSQRTILRSLQFSTYRRDVITQLEMPHVLYDPGDTVEVSVTTRRHDETPLSLPGNLLIERLIETDQCSGEGKGEVIAETPVQTDATGFATLSQAILLSGEYRAIWKPKDSFGAANELSILFYVGEPTQLFDTATKQRPRVIVDQPLLNSDGIITWNGSYNERLTSLADHPIPYLVLTSGRPKSALLTLFSDRFESARTIALSGPATRGELRLPVTFGRGAQASFDVIDNGTPTQTSFSFEIDHQLEPLQVEMMVEKQVLRPGEEQSLQLEVYQPDGTPAIGREISVSVSVYDEALLAFGDDRTGLKDISPKGMLPAFRYLWIQSNFGSILNLQSPVEIEEGMEDEVFELSPFCVLESADSGYVTANSTSTTSLATTLLDLPMGLEVINSEFIEDIGASSFSGDLQYSAGIDSARHFESAPIALRRDFRRSAYWTAHVVVDADGHATVRFPLPDLATSWRVEAIAVGPGGSDLGGNETSFQTALPVVGNLRLPRFLVEGDEAALSILARNNSDESIPLHLALGAEGVLGGSFASKGEMVPAGESIFQSWLFHAEQPGEAQLTGAVLSPLYSDGMVETLTVIPHGFEQQVTRTSTVAKEKTKLSFELPKGADPTSIRFEVTVESGFTAAIARALPYLIEYPYDCVEQTTSRLVPVTRFVEALTKTGIERLPILQAIGFESEEAYALFRSTALQRLQETYNYGYDAWGWFSSEHPDPYMTAYAYWGQMLARADGLELFDPERLDDVADYLNEWIATNSHLSLRTRAWILFASLSRNLVEASAPTENEQLAFAECLENLDQLDLSARVWVTLAAHWMARPDDAEATLGKILRQARHSTAPGTGVEYVSWGSAQTGECSCEGNTEASAWVLLLLQTLEPDNPLIAPTREALLASRESGRWESTRATMIALTALQMALDQDSTKNGPSTLQWTLNRSPRNKVEISADPIRPTTWQVSAKLLHSGTNQLTVRTESNHSARLTATLSYYDRSESIAATSSGAQVARRYFRITHTPTLLNGPREVLVPLTENESIEAGEEIEVCLTIETPIDLAYLLIEDRRPAGCEDLRQVSGYGAPLRQVAGTDADGTIIYNGREQWTYVEPRDQLRAAFLDSLPAGTWEWRYRVRAETAGTFHALPAKIEAMYAPQFRGTSDEAQIVISPAPELGATTATTSE